MMNRHKWTFAGIGSALLLFIILAVLWQAELISLFQKKPHIAVGNNRDNDVYHQYIGNVYVDVEQKIITGNMHVRAFNKSQQNHKAIYFHLYPNVFKDNDLLQDANWDYVLGKDRIPGWIEIEEVWVNGNLSSFNIENTVLEVPLERWAAGEEIDIELRFQLQVPKNNGRLSYDAHAIWLGNWLPMVAQYDDSGWYLDPYYPIGDPFYSDIAHYDFEVNLPSDYQLASSGVEQELISVDGERKLFSVRAQHMRDFAFVIMDDTYKKISEDVDGVTVNTWYRSIKSKVAEKLHKVGVESIKYFSSVYGDYPYPEYDIVQTGGFFGGMEYPGIVFIQGVYFEENDDYGVVVVAHETGHQWWYGLVGNNEVSDPWMDESLTEYSTLRFLLSAYPEIGRYVLKSKEQSINYANRFERNKEYVRSAVHDFSNWESYGLLVYNNGAIMFYRLEQAIGVEKMNEILRDYFTQYQYKNASRQDIITIFEKHLGKSVHDYFEAWLQGGEAEFEPSFSSFPLSKTTK